jgi:adenine deaminase
MNKESIPALKERIKAARGEIPSDLVLKGGRIINVFSGTLEDKDIAVHGGFVVGVGCGYRAVREVDLSGLYIGPGMIDGHIHVESSMLLPSRLAAPLLLCGTTAVVSDPHEIANVMGMEGIRLMLEDSRDIPLDVFFMAPSCVPATHLETSGARLGAADLEDLAKEPRILGLAEVMNFPGVLSGHEDVLHKIALFNGKRLDGHAPGLRGKDLQAYIGVGIRSDHETTDRDEAIEKLQSGMMIMVREGSTARNLDDLLPLIGPVNSRRFCFVSDDLHPEDLRQRGHLNHILRKAVAGGLEPVTAVQMVSLNPAEYFGLHDRGAVAAGYRADFVVFKDLEDFRVDRVYKNGRLAAEGGRLAQEWLKRHTTAAVQRPLAIPPLHSDRFRIKKEGEEARVIEMIPNQIVTRACREKVLSRGDWVISDPGKDILKIAVVERHKGSGRVGLGLVRGFGLKRGALASSVAHDSHNLIAVGVHEHDLCRAVEEVRGMGGGMVVTDQGKTLARVPLAVGGLMSTDSLGRLSSQLGDLSRACAALGCAIEQPFMALSFLALPVIPELKITDMGLVDVKRFEIVSLFYEKTE